MVGLDELINAVGVHFGVFFLRLFFVVCIAFSFGLLLFFFLFGKYLGLERSFLDLRFRYQVTFVYCFLNIVR